MPFAAPTHDKLADAAPGLEELAAIRIRRPQDKQLLVNILDALAERILTLVRSWREEPATTTTTTAANTGWMLDHGVAGA